MMGALRVAVVGAGASGLCVARHVLARADAFAPPVVYELCGHVGGTWFYEERVGCHDDGLPVQSSMYKNLRTNLPKEVMMFPDFPFDPSLPSFPSHQEVQRYLERYCEEHLITSHIRFKTVVERVSPVAVETEGEGPRRSLWEVTSSDGAGSQKTETFDSVFVCSGHFSDPHIPDIPGIQFFKGRVLHSHSYRTPEPFSGQSVAVLGAGASGLDISLELARVGTKVILSHSKPRFTFPLPPTVSQATRLLRVQEDGALLFQDGSVARVQVLLLCTGYNFSYPFLDMASVGLKVQQQLVSPLYRYMMPPSHPSLFIIGICKIICPFPHFHCQAQFALGTLEGSVALPSPAQMAREAQGEAERKLALGVHSRHLLNLDQDQWAYYGGLARDARFPPLPPVLESLYHEVWRQRRLHPQNYRDVNYRLVSDTRWEVRE